MDDFGDKVRKQLSDQEKKAARIILRRFQSLAKTIEIKINDLLFKLQAGKQAGLDFQYLLFEKRYLFEMLAEVRNEIDKIAPSLAEVIETAQNSAIDIVEKTFFESNRPELSTRIRAFDLDSTRILAGFTADGSPLSKHFQKLANPIQEFIFQVLTDGIGFGRSNDQIATELKKAVPRGAINALTTARTETNRAYRESARQFLETVPGVIGWRWTSPLDLRTCPICWSRHGKIYPTKEKFGTHPNCRCVMIAVFANDPNIESGSERFKKLTIAQQKAILGNARFELYSTKGVKLSDFVAEKQTIFGKTPYLKNLSEFDDITRLKKVKIENLNNLFPSFFKNTADAQKWLENKFSSIEFDFSGVNKTVVHKVAKEFNRLADKFPDVVSSLEYFGTYKDLSKKYNRRRGYKFSRNAFAHASTDGKRIGLNPAFFNSPKKLIEALSESARDGWLVSDEIESVISHEFGHQVDNWLTSLKSETLTPLVRSNDQTSVSKINEAIRRKYRPQDNSISIYAKKNGAEQFAESFSQSIYKKQKDWAEYTKFQNEFIEYMASKPLIFKKPISFFEASAAEKEKHKIIEESLLKRFGLTLDDFDF